MSEKLEKWQRRMIRLPDWLGWFPDGVSNADYQLIGKLIRTYGGHQLYISIIPGDPEDFHYSLKEMEQKLLKNGGKS